MVKYSALSFRFGVVLLVGLLTSYLVKDLIEPAVVLGLSCSVAAGNVAAGMGLKVSNGMKHLCLVVLFSLPFGFTGLLVGQLVFN